MPEDWKILISSDALTSRFPEIREKDALKTLKWVPPLKDSGLMYLPMEIMLVKQKRRIVMIMTSKNTHYTDWNTIIIKIFLWKSHWHVVVRVNAVSSKTSNVKWIMYYSWDKMIKIFNRECSCHSHVIPYLWHWKNQGDINVLPI